MKKIIISFILLIVIGSLLGITFFGLRLARQSARKISDANNLKNTGLSLRFFSSAYEGNYPMDMGDLWGQGFLCNGRIYICSGAKEPTPVPENADDIRNGYCDFLYFGSGQKESDFDNKKPLMCTKPGIYGDDFIIVLYGDGHVSSYNIIPLKVQDAINKNELWWKNFRRPIRGFIDVDKNKGEFLFDYIYDNLFYSFKIGEGSMQKSSSKGIKESGKKLKFILSEKSNQMLLTILNIIERDKLYELKPEIERGNRMYSNQDRVIYNTSIHSGEFDVDDMSDKEFYLFRFRIRTFLASLQTDLILAVRKGDIKEVERLLATNIDINAQDKNGTTALMLVAKHGYSKIAEKLLQKNPNLKIKDWGEKSALGWAMLRDHKVMIKLLRNAGADVNIGNPVLIESVWNNPEKIPELIKSGVHVDSRDTRGKTALMAAVDFARPHSLNTAKLLLQLGADVNAKNNKGQTPLMHASEYFIFSKLLIENGADVNAVDQNKETALLFAVQEWRSNPPVKQNTAVVRLLIENGANVNARNSSGRTALMNTYSDDLSEILIKYGADTNDYLKMNQDLFCDSLHGEKKRVKFLLDKGLDPNWKNKSGETALMWACINGNNEIAEILIKAGAKVNVQDNEGISPMMEALQHGNANTIKLLMKNGGDISLKNKNGKTVLELAEDMLKNKEELHKYPHHKREQHLKEIIKLIKNHTKI